MTPGRKYLTLEERRQHQLQRDRRHNALAYHLLFNMVANPLFLEYSKHDLDESHSLYEKWQAAEALLDNAQH